MICVVEKGMIVEKGKHDELLLLRGIYYDLVEHQISAQTLNNVRNCSISQTF
jgi:ABC-type multidrug transport system fused ATPase/permease subunit